MRTTGGEHQHGAQQRRRREADLLAPAAAYASVAIDVGGGYGALLLYPGTRFHGCEIELSPADDEGARVHTGVHERTTIAHSGLTAVFGSLPAGEYVVWEDADTPGPVVTVADGQVTELTLT